jgi:predicted transcriptional regulator
MEASTLIRNARRAAGLTQAELAKRARMKQPEIARLEAAGANPRLSTLSRVVAATGHVLKLDLDETGGIDRTMIAANLQVPPDERLSQFEGGYRSIARLVGSAGRAS